MMLTILGIFYAAMVLAGYAVEFAFGGLGLIPAERVARVAEAASRGTTPRSSTSSSCCWPAALLVRFFRSGGGPMLKMMGGSPEDGHGH